MFLKKHLADKNNFIIYVINNVFRQLFSTNNIIMASSQELNNSTKQELVDFGIHYLDIVVCPLDFNHKLRRHRLPYHLLKCKKNYPDKIQCPYGHYYYCDKHEMANHLITCPHKPKMVLAEEMHPNIIQAQHTKNDNLIHNYDVDNYAIDEPYWD